MNHWIILPILLPAIVAPMLVLAVRHDVVLARVFSLASAVLLVLVAGILLGLAVNGGPHIYALGNWAPPFGIVLVLDRLSALMLLLTSFLAVGALLFAVGGADKRGRHFHALFQLQLMGVNGAFLTGDLFNLFVFFEVLLIASYGLMVHGGGSQRLRAGVQYVVVNLVGSSLFLIAVGLIYGVTGTLNMADLAVKVATMEAGDQALLQTGGLLLLLVFAIKAAMVPVQFWLPGTYALAPAPVAALFAIMTKVGAYCIIRVHGLVFGEGAGEAAHLIHDWLLPAALITLVVGMTGVLASRRLGQMTSFAVIGSMGMIMVPVALYTHEALSAALYYLVHSTLAAGALFLIVGLVAERRGSLQDRLVVGPVFAQSGLLAAGFFMAAVAMAGLPPLSGFLGKLLILDAARDVDANVWIWTAILASSFLAIVGFARGGSTLFWKPSAMEREFDGVHEPAGGAVPFVAVGILLAGLVMWTVLAGPATHYLDATATQLLDRQRYIDAVLN
ncbi:monovalent cation/H+ antiporter subunit D [Ectothiorhodospira marina]|uniref:Multicomponent K+:H+ antiporter subunit D n=1 Tax=Ectothiorhodospira marina TaxID=1396821 RepID=A0A1H7HJR9_9GAMM|nr:monovalent cation/H+ antiporter subunit D [Ectothiorhodospira marina]SEK50633.1 multicomponent K+:H+ antiporter subunit D [Ectothiorhodospira marina]